MTQLYSTFSVSYTHLDVYKRQVIAEGTPEEVARCEESYTGMFLRKVLN